jgi:hypothetical protein
MCLWLKPEKISEDMMSNKENSSHWFSAVGAKRGIGLAAVIALVWLAWAYGYTQGLAASDQVNQSVELELKPIQLNK